MRATLTAMTTRVTMPYRVTDNFDPTPDDVRKWGYGDDLVFMEQDEDLLLYNTFYFPVLLELAGDEACPKGGYAFSILCQFSREQVTRGGAKGAAYLRAAWQALPPPTGRLPVEWHQYVGRLLAYTEPTGPVDHNTARRMAEELLLGEERIGNLTEGPAPLAGWRFTLRTSITEHIDVCEATGAFSYLREY
jgi:hypothetical protein